MRSELGNPIFDFLISLLFTPLCETLASDTIEFDTLARVSISEHGAFVHAWGWVSTREREEQTKDPQD